jgi:fosfomycin resistance protein FosX
MYSEKITELGLETIPDRKRIAGEGKSIYFHDYDNHLFELHTGSLDDRLTHYNI